ncbi:cyclic nucleotide-binding domain-containing protein [Phormidium sp. CLA17]|uniref:cyclic nucleotide-binding domain-containing protein n=1 Tax=Leptolyngbya sp. Cla-17 TaxID=2803751 RepID=UPI0014929AE4|nr:cyclic nucleotide-binding domain-containing protein [Leptolyngbya sp. Cla-17]MBM0743486.1 cyclic nucleotide-binding domain-containing protein [Leptolyngbya sp. Cla-17]
MKTVLFLLGELDDDDIDWMLATGTREKIPAGTVLIKEGIPIDSLFILLEGILSVTTAVTQGCEIANLLSGDIVGEMSFIDTRPPSATVSAKEAALVLCIPREKLAERLKLDIGFAARFYHALAICLSSRMRFTVNQLKNRDQPQSSNLSHDLPVGELTKDALENVELAKTRLDWLLRRLKDS